MPLKKLVLKPGINRENTRYTTEGGWYDCDKVRFRQGNPEKIGGWQRISAYTFLGVCRSLWAWVTLGRQNLLGVGTNLKFYVELGGQYNDITPLRSTVTLTDPFETTNASAIVEVTDANGGYINGDFVTFTDATAVGGITLNGEYQITYTAGNVYNITAASAATSSATGGGTVTAAYQINIGPLVAVPLVGWSAGGWGEGVWGTGGTSSDPVRLWSQANFGEDLVYGVRRGALYYWDATSGLNARGVLLSSLAGATGVPDMQNIILVSDVSRFLFLFGTKDYLSAVFDPMLVRWPDQESLVDWAPSATNQAGSLQLSRGAEIIAAAQARQEILVWTDSSLYAMQYLGAPIVWGAQLVGENISIISQNGTATAAGATYWMGKDKFYMYNGRVQTLRCDVLKYVFSGINHAQNAQVFAGTNEGFSEVWWFYCSAGSDTVDSYVVYNYEADIWYYGAMARSAWLDSGLRGNPIAATYSYNIVDQEVGVDCQEYDVAAPIDAFIVSAQFDIDDGHAFSFIWRILPDITFSGSTVESATAMMTLYPLKNSGSGYTDPDSVGGTNSAAVTRSVVLPIQQYTGQLNTRVRGRQMAIKVQSTDLGVTWQLGSPRIDIRPDGRR